jgi:membrane-associated protease RseP (regulator of RpoE activity)
LTLQVPLEDGSIGDVFVDTGDSSGVSLSEDRWKQWTLQHPESPSTLAAYFTPQVGFVVRSEAWASLLPVGSLRIADVPVALTSVKVGKKYSATLGVYALTRIHLILDGANGVAYVKPATEPAPRYEHNRLGAVFTPKDLQSEPLIAHVAKGSPADLAGIRDGDQLTKIDELDVTKWRTDPQVLPLARFFERPAGTELRLTVKRDSAERVFTVSLKDILAPTTAPASQRVLP